MSLDRSGLNGQGKEAACRRLPERKNVGPARKSVRLNSQLAKKLPKCVQCPAVAGCRKDRGERNSWNWHHPSLITAYFLPAFGRAVMAIESLLACQASPAILACSPAG